jgi:hypothetical protein
MQEMKRAPPQRQATGPSSAGLDPPGTLVAIGSAARFLLDEARHSRLHRIDRAWRGPAYRGREEARHEALAICQQAEKNGPSQRLEQAKPNRHNQGAVFSRTP